MGNSATKVGYGCDQVALVALWRRVWAATSATDPLAPFGIVTLAAGGSEGAGYNMAHMRWSQTGNMGALPNAMMPATFLAQAYDIGDPWARGNRGGNCSSPDPTTGKVGPDCVPLDAASWNPAVRPLLPRVANSSATPFFMGPIHPRFKHEVGRRLATALMKNVSGPTISGCSVTAGSKIVISLDPARMGGEDVTVQPFNTNISSWTGTDSSSLMVCTGALGPAVSNATSCACSGWAFLRAPCTRVGCNCSNHGDDQTEWYCKIGPGWKPSSAQLELSVARHVEEVALTQGDVAATPGQPATRFGWVPSRNPYEAIWRPAPLKKGSAAHSLVVDLTQVNGSSSVFALRYGWPFSGDTCCPSQLVNKGLAICRPASCPVLSATTNLPMNGFFATVASKKCKCLPPQVCDA